MINRRHFLNSVGIGITILGIPEIYLSCSKEPDRPNILWITSEDNGPFLGCYGDDFATTPRLDKLASEGILYENAFASAPVCAPARCTIITGVYPPSMGTQHMRSQYPIPEFIKLYPEYLRANGYYCTNNSKTDYNFFEPKMVWDESSRKAHYKNRKPGQPFFAIFNITVSHESSIHTPVDKLRHDPDKVKLPPYHPDTPDIRHDWAQYYDKVQDMDTQVGKFLDELEAEGLRENTIVFYYSDHAGVLARSKRFMYDTGLHVPFLVRFPKKYQHLVPSNPGNKTDRLISFVDLAPTVLSLTGVPIPDYMQGKAFLGTQSTEPRKYIYAFRGRMDERYDMVRVVRDKQYKYIKNFNPHRIYGQFIEYLWRAPATKSWEKFYLEGKCNTTQSAFWEEKPSEELYDTTIDPYEVHNLAENPEYEEKLIKMRQVCQDWLLEIRDAGFMPEGEMVERSKDRTIFELTHDTNYPLERIMSTAYLATSRKVEQLPELLNKMKDEDSIVRYWAVTGCLILGDKATSAVPEIEKCLKDPSADVRITAAEFLCNMGKTATALPVLIAELKNQNSKVALHAANSLHYLGKKATPALSALKEAVKREDDNYVVRAATYTVEILQKM